ncbi:GntR family transcriptional regulator [Paenibacillus camelliae]|uniref:GntR family transcriptional regulator n=1 Tax=Paenibacillus camelliae TaxID=512410 RepID=UPI00203FCBC0|nr:GntR family transcriptional regulator [Paenibacillus camelliae]
MLLSIDLQSETPIYTQIAESIIEGIARGELAKGEGLPSVRALAVDLGVNLHTVNKAYQLLKQEGYVQINRKQGVVIEPNEFPKADELFKRRQAERMKPIIAEAICRGMTQEQIRELFYEVHESLQPRQQ